MIVTDWLIDWLWLIDDCLSLVETDFNCLFDWLLVTGWLTDCDWLIVWSSVTNWLIACVFARASLLEQQKRDEEARKKKEKEEAEAREKQK